MTRSKTSRRARGRPSNPLQTDFFQSLDQAHPSRIALVEVPDPVDPAAGTLDDDHRVRRLLWHAIRRSTLDRDAIAARMATLTGRRTTHAMLDTWTGPARENAFKVRDLRAFVAAVGGDLGWFWESLTEGSGYCVLSRQDAEMARIGQLALLARCADREIAQAIAAAPRIGGAA